MLAENCRYFNYVLASTSCLFYKHNKDNTKIIKNQFHPSDGFPLTKVRLTPPLGKEMLENKYLMNVVQPKDYNFITFL